MSTVQEITFRVETIRAGQPRPYADSEYEYIVSGEEKRTLHDGSVRNYPISINVLKSYCTGVLRPSRQTHEVWAAGQNSNADVYFAGYHTFSEVQGRANAVRYYVREPFCD